jgi:hypothetical protein
VPRERARELPERGVKVLEVGVQDHKQVQLANEKVIGNGSFGVVFQVCLALLAAGDCLGASGRGCREIASTSVSLV